MEKTNVMRLLDSSNISYNCYEYDPTQTDGQMVAQLVGKPCYMVFKTLVTVGSDNEHYVFVVPVDSSLDLKKGAKAVGVKSIQMIKQKELLPLTGYIHGGCSPIGMKKQFKTVIDETAILNDTICVSAGRVGKQIEINPEVLREYINASFCDISA
jgi:Cys-tRNA(Pro)/Cys-tRNA(Cys) deacylase